MYKINTITKEKEAEIPAFINKWVKKASEPTNKELANNSINQLYKRIGKDNPIIIWGESPMQCVLFQLLFRQLDSQLGSQLDSQLDSQLYSQLDSQLDSQLGSQLRSQLDSQLDSQLYSQLGSQLRSQLRSQLDSQLDSQLYSQLGSQLRSQLDSQLGSQLDSQLDSQLYSQLDSQLGSQLRSQLRSQLDSQLDSQLGSQLDSQLDSQLYSQLDSQLYSQLGSYYVCVWWMGWAGYYDFTKNIGVKFDEEKLNLFINTVCEIPVIWAFDGICFVSEKPNRTHWTNNILHNEFGKSVEFKDGWGWSTWKGVMIPDEYLNKESITKETIINEKNAERRRAIQEILGDNAFAERLDLIEIDSDVDEYLKPLKLYRTKEEDSLTEEHIFFLKVTDTSTDREYYLCVPEFNNVWEARAYTFNMTKEEYQPDIQS